MGQVTSLTFFLHDLAAVFAEQSAAGMHIDRELCSEFAVGLADASRKVELIEAKARAFDSLSAREAAEAVRGMPIEERRAFAREALREAKSNIVPLSFETRFGRQCREVAAEFVGPGDVA